MVVLEGNAWDGNVLTDSGACLKNQRGFQLQLYPAVRSRDDREGEKKGTSPEGLTSLG